MFILCLFSIVTFSGCVGSVGGGYGGSSSDSGSGGGHGGGGGSFNPPKYDPPAYEYEEDDINDVFAGAIGVYQLGSDDKAFYDKYKKSTMSFNELADRHFETMATFIFESLNRFYGEVSSEETSPATTFGISGYSQTSNLDVSFDGVINDANQKIIGKVSTGELQYSEQLNYSNAVNGGYKLDVSTGDSGLSVTYSETLLNGVDGNPDHSWIGKTYFNKDTLKKALKYIYINTQATTSTSSNISFASDADISLKNYYISFNFSNITGDVSMDSVASIELTSKYLWNVAYFIGYSIVGESNVNNSLNSHNTIFVSSSSEITPISADNQTENVISAFQSYKGYHIVLSELVNQMSKLSIKLDSSSTPIGVEYVAGNNWEKTMFPSVVREKYVYYDNVDEISDTYVSDTYGSNQKPDALGTSQKLKKIIYLPYINTEKVDKSDFNVSTWGISVVSKNGNNYSLQIKYKAVFSSVTESGLMTFGGGWGEESSDSTDTLTFNGEPMSGDMEIMEADIKGNFSNTITKYGNTYPISQLMSDSFHQVSKNVNYSNGESKAFQIGVLQVYNPLFVNGVMQIASNFLELEFVYKNSAGQTLTDTPETYLETFQLILL